MIAKNLAASACFWLGRSLLSEWVANFVKKNETFRYLKVFLARPSGCQVTSLLYRSIVDSTSQSGWQLVLAARLSPARTALPDSALTDPGAQLPSYVCSYGFSVTQVSFKEYFLATLFASAPMIFINVGLGAGAKNIQDAFSGKVTEDLS